MRPPAPRPRTTGSPPHARRRRPATTLAAALLALAALAAPGSTATAGTAPGPAGENAPAEGRQADFAAASAATGVPTAVLLGVAYLESRWDAHQGTPSTDAGYGPMHLTDPAAALAATGHHDGAEDPRGDDARPLRPDEQPTGTTDPTGTTEAAGADTAAEVPPTLRTAATLTGLPPERLRTDPAANILGGAALLAHHQRELGLPGSDDPGRWYAAVARYAGASDAPTARWFADEVYATIRAGAARTTDDGHAVTLPAHPEVAPDRAQLDALDLPAGRTGPTECPPTLPCEWIPAPYQVLDGDDYGNHDQADRPESQKISHIVIHDTETSYDGTIRLVQDPAYVSWHYTLRSRDGHVAQHVPTEDVAWHAGNWYVNAKSIGLEHEGFLAQGGAWYTEAMYRASARLVRYLAHTHDIPLDRAHIVGHDNVPGTTPSTVAGMHEDPGPYWDWAHYFDLLGAPLHRAGPADSGSVVILPDFATHTVPYTGCAPARPLDPCPEQGSGSVLLRTAPRHDAPLVTDVGKRPGGATMSVHDHSARASTGQHFAVAERRGDWTAIWYLGQKAWLHNPAQAPTALPSRDVRVTPAPGRTSIPVFGRAYPEAAAYPAGVPAQPLTPMQYQLPAGQVYTAGPEVAGEYYRAVTFDTAGHQVVRGTQEYRQIQFGHRFYFVRAEDVVVLPAPGTPALEH
ncbi:N-acetylmuramoyl-L-alanine amidase [Allostreptomyces psammosilenae]|uniref:N-acetylmuramoyl-L-alanine amidase n=1 Tax=Allostreptomyces psammosilenae TaxID=1892865 RepID=A0A853A2P2_9ACTN|nr:N-acetylmuramoyl-L-alanine amidase [Allostreptomyces psammosilenae]NYI04782.1 hypothetical protein [Allostreptomyces psammosilenae]